MYDNIKSKRVPILKRRKAQSEILLNRLGFGFGFGFGCMIEDVKLVCSGLAGGIDILSFPHFHQVYIRECFLVGSLVLGKEH